MNALILDCATAPLADAADYAEPVKAPSNWKDQAKIDAYVAEKTAERVESAALDLDLARLTGIGYYDDGAITVHLCKTEDDERVALIDLAKRLRDAHGGLRSVITYNGTSYDIPLVMRRARYLGVAFPRLSTDRYKSTNIDLMLDLTDRDPSRRRPLGFYVRRLGMGLTKTLSGAEESRVHETGNWDGLRESLLHDVEAVRRLAVWLGVIA